MKAIKIINLFVLVLLCQVGFAQSNGILKSFNLRMDKSVAKGLDNTNITKALKVQFEIPENYEFKYKTIKGTKDVTSKKDELGYVHERYAQYYKGIKIEHSDIRVHYLDGLFVSANGEYIDVPDIDVSIVLSNEEAIQKAKEYIGAKEYMWEKETRNEWLKSITNDEGASFYPNPEIVICKNSIDFQYTTFHVAYKIDIYAKEPLSHDCIFVDAKNGRILAVDPILVSAVGIAETRYSGTRSIPTQQNDTTYRLRGYDNNRNVETYNMNKGNDIEAAVDFTDNDNYWTAEEFPYSTKEDGALDAHWGAVMTYDYFKNIHNRDSYDDEGSVIRGYVHCGSIIDDAQWNKKHNYMIYGDGNSYNILTSLDIVAHEIGHGVCVHTADLIYSGESGAINESLSDIWAACVQNYAAPTKNIWLLGDEISYAHPPKPLRNMSNPHLSKQGQPDTYGGGAYWTGPNAGVHTNSGIMNHWFYILSEGKTGTNGIGNTYNVTGIGISDAEKIVYRAESAYMTANTNFADARAHSIQSAIDLYGDCTPEVIAVTNAWHAVGVGDLFQGPGTTTISNVTYVSNTTINACNLVLNNVTVGNGAKLTIDANETTINGPFEVTLGSELEIK
jgi:Zinc metalloprotease (elastase)